MLGLRGELVHDNGAYMPWGIILPWIAATTVPGPYVLPAYRLDVDVGADQQVPATPVRGAGRPQAVVRHGAHDGSASRASSSLDRAEVRRRNFIQPEQMPYRVGIMFRDGRR